MGFVLCPLRLLKPFCSSNNPPPPLFPVPAPHLYIPSSVTLVFSVCLPVSRGVFTGMSGGSSRFCGVWKRRRDSFVCWLVVGKQVVTAGKRRL